MKNISLWADKKQLPLRLGTTLEGLTFSYNQYYGNVAPPVQLSVS